MTLTERLAARRCKTTGCDRPAITDGAYCADCTNHVWSTGRRPVVARWQQDLKVKELTRG